MTETSTGPRNRRRLTLRMRLTVNYAAVLAAAMTLMGALVYTVMRLIPVEIMLAPAVLPDHLGAVDVRRSTAHDMFSTVLLVLALAIVVTGVVGGLVGWFVAGRALSPLRSISAAARQASAQSLGHRVALTGPRDELLELSETFDDMLDRLEHAFQAQQLFAANASHELRTPLAATQTIIDIALAEDQPTASRQTLEQLRQMNTRSINTVEALLDLSSASHHDFADEVVDLADLLSGALTDVDDEVFSRKLTVTVTREPALTHGNAMLLHQLVGNLVQNAVRHNVTGGSVLVECGGTPDYARLCVSNSGAGVDPQTLHLLSEPFYRSTGRTRPDSRGQGLGLAIAVAIVRAHDGTIEITANDIGGLTATVTLHSPTEGHAPRSAAT